MTFGPATKHLQLLRGHAGDGPAAYRYGSLLKPQATETGWNDRDQQIAAKGLSTPQDAIAILLHRLVRRLPTITTLAEHIAPTKRTTTLPISKKKNATCTTLFTCVSRNGNRSVHLGYTKPIFLHKWPPLLKRPPL